MNLNKFHKKLLAPKRNFVNTVKEKEQVYFVKDVMNACIINVV
jgi:hypothetical protein